MGLILIQYPVIILKHPAGKLLIGIILYLYMYKYPFFTGVGSENFYQFVNITRRVRVFIRGKQLIQFFIQVFEFSVKVKHLFSVRNEKTQEIVKQILQCSFPQ